jgi:hypothetical protein
VQARELHGTVGTKVAAEAAPDRDRAGKTQSKAPPQSNIFAAQVELRIGVSRWIPDQSRPRHRHAQQKAKDGVFRSDQDAPASERLVSKDLYYELSL